MKFGTNQQEIIKFPNVLIFFRPMQAPTGGTIGTTVNHIGFSVPDLRPVVDKIKANGFKMITRSGSGRQRQEVKDDIAAAESHHVDRLRARTRRGEGRARPGEDTDGADPAAPRALLRSAERRDASLVRQDVRREGSPGESRARRSCRLICPVSRSTSRPRPRQSSARPGRALDHIGFEIKNLEAFTKKLEADGIKLDVRIARCQRSTSPSRSSKIPGAPTSS